MKIAKLEMPTHKIDIGPVIFMRELRRRFFFGRSRFIALDLMQARFQLSDARFVLPQNARHDAGNPARAVDADGQIKNKHRENPDGIERLVAREREIKKKPRPAPCNKLMSVATRWERFSPIHETG
jgi:hypothetical protein